MNLAKFGCSVIPPLFRVLYMCIYHNFRSGRGGARVGRLINLRSSVVVMLHFPVRMTIQELRILYLSRLIQRVIIEVEGLVLVLEGIQKGAGRESGEALRAVGTTGIPPIGGREKGRSERVAPT